MEQVERDFDRKVDVADDKYELDIVKNDMNRRREDALDS